MARRRPQVPTIGRELLQHLLLHVEEVHVAGRIGGRIADGPQHRVVVTGTDTPLLTQDDLAVAGRLFRQFDHRRRSQCRSRRQQQEQERMACRESHHRHDSTPVGCG